MNIFEQLATETELDRDIDSHVERICEKVKSLSLKEIRVLENLTQKANNHDEIRKIRTEIKTFAEEKGLHGDWVRIVKIVDNSRTHHMWHTGWGAVYDHCSAMLLKPYFGVVLSQKYFDTLTAPLRSVLDDA